MTPATRAAHNTFSVRWHNRRLLLLNLLEQQPISRVRLARLTGLSTTTVTNLTSELIQEGVVAEIGVDVIAQPRGAGRPPLALSLVADSRHAIGVHIGVRSVRLVLCDLMVGVLDRDEFPIVRGSPPEAVIDAIRTAVARLQERHAHIAKPDQLVGVGVGASGLVDGVTGVNYLAPNLGWRDLPLRDMLYDVLDLPVVVDNNVRYMALGESMYGVGRGVRALAFVYARVGLAAGLVVDGKIYRGAGYGAGEIGHWLMTPAVGPGAPAQTLEDLLSERTLVRLARDIAPGSFPGDPADSHEEMLTLLAAARDGDRALQDLLTERAGYLGVAMTNLVDVLNPECLILGGYLADGHDLFAPILVETMRRHAFAGLANKVTVMPTAFGDGAGAIGAAAGALNHFFFGAAELSPTW